MSKKEINSVPSLIDYMTKAIGKDLDIIKLNDIKERDIVGCPVPSPQFDYVLESSQGQVPYGSIIEIIGWESVGKTTFGWQFLATELLKCFQSTGLFIDVERAGFGYSLAKSFNVDGNRCWIVQPRPSEKISVADLTFNATKRFLYHMIKYRETDSVKKLVEKDKPHGIIIIDSVAALNPEVLVEVEEEKKKSQKAALASVMSEQCRKLTPIVASSGCILIFINQWRNAFNFQGQSWNEPCGGKSLRFYADLRFSINKVSTEKINDVEVGLKCKIICIKNKLGTPRREAIVIFGWGNGPYDLGMDIFNDLFIMSKEKGFRLQPAGSSWSTIFRGKSATLGVLINTNNFNSKIKKRLLDTKNKKEKDATLKENGLTDIRFQGLMGFKKRILEDKKLLDDLISVCNFGKHKSLFHDRYKILESKQIEINNIEEEDIIHEIDEHKTESGGKVKQIDDGNYTSTLPPTVTNDMESHAKDLEKKGYKNE